MKEQIAEIKFGLAFRKRGRRHGTYVDLQVLSGCHLHVRPVCPLADVFADLVFQRAVVGLEGFAETVLKRCSLGQRCEQLDELSSSLPFGAQDQVVNESPRFGVEHPLLRCFVVFRRVLLNRQQPLYWNELRCLVQHRNMLFGRASYAEFICPVAHLESAVALRKSLGNP